MSVLRKADLTTGSYAKGAFALAMAVAFVAVARAGSAKDADAGKEFAMKACSPCHLVGAHPSGARASHRAGPAFADIARSSKAAPEALRDFLHSTQNGVSHPLNMPNPHLTEEQIHLISAYLSSLRNSR